LSFLSSIESSFRTLKLSATNLNPEMMLPLNEVSDGKDASLYGLNRTFSTSVSAKPLSQFDRQVFNPTDACGRYGADIKLATHK
jgi:hypothetical protein